MTNYLATLVHGKRGGEGKYEFEGPDNLLRKKPVRIMQAFMDGVEAKTEIGFMDYEINAALKNKDDEIVTVIGEIEFDGGDEQPLMCMLSRAPDPALS